MSVMGSASVVQLLVRGCRENSKGNLSSNRVDASRHFLVCIHMGTCTQVYRAQEDDCRKTASHNVELAVHAIRVLPKCGRHIYTYIYIYV